MEFKKALPLFVFACVAGLAAGSEIVVTPSANQFIAVNSTDNVTFRCDVRGGGSPSPSRDAVWTIQGRQIRGITGSFESGGIIIVVIEPGLSEVTITNEARMSFLNHPVAPTPTITVQCSSFTGSFSGGELPVTEEGDEFAVTTFDIPTRPTGLLVDPNPRNVDELIFSWVAPTGEGQFSAVNITYTVVITGPFLNFSTVTTQTFSVVDNDVSQNCEPHLFSVYASNEAGPGPVASVMDTIPISPDTTDIDNRFRISEVLLSSPIALTLFVPRALSCNSRFPIFNHSFSIPSLAVNLNLNFNEEEQFNGMFPIAELERDQEYQVFVEACISITCRQSQPRVLRTTDVQTASIVFFENNIFLNCTFASNSDASGCRFQLMLVNGTEPFFLTQSASSVSQCNQTMNQADAYVAMLAVDVEANGALGMLPIVLRPLILEDAGEYMSITGCSIPEPQNPLSGGAIAGIVIAVLIVGAVVLAVVVIVVVYRIRTGHWFKLREKDDEKLTVHFEKELLMGDIKPKKKSKVGASFRGSVRKSGPGGNGHSSPDVGEEGTAIVLADSVSPEHAALPPKPTSEEHDMGLATNPHSAFTLDISSDRKKVRLHLNRALIKRVLQDKKLNTVDRRKARRQNSVSRQHLLPLQCEVRVEEVEDEENNN